MIGKPSAKIILDTRRPFKGEVERFPVKLQIVFQLRKGKWFQKYYRTGIAMSVEDFAAMNKGSKRVTLEDARRTTESKLEQAKEIIKKNDRLTPEIFHRKFTGGDGTTVKELFDKYVSELEEFGQVGNAKIYRTAINSFIEFVGSDFGFVEISQDWLRRYQKFMQAKTKEVDGKKVNTPATVTTISIRLRCLRKIFNDAIEQDIISADYYPFGRRRFTIQSVVKPKIALSMEQKNRVLAYKNESCQRGIDFWVMLYFLNGMAISDLLQLTNREKSGGVIYLDRGKTLRTNKTLKKIEIPVRPEVERLIAKYRRSLNPDDYIFPVLDMSHSPSQKKNRIQDFTDSVNDDLKTAAKDLGFTFDFTSYTARHTFASISLINGATKEQIQEAMGHSSMQTTENYLAGFEFETKKKMNDRL